MDKEFRCKHFYKSKNLSKPLCHSNARHVGVSRWASDCSLDRNCRFYEEGLIDKIGRFLGLWEDREG